MKISTKLNKGAVAQTTNLTIVGGSPETWKALGMQALVVKLQGKFRSDEVIPAEFTVNVDEWAPGSRHGGSVNVFEVAKTLSADDRAKLLAMLQEKK